MITVLPERKLALIHRVLVPDKDYPKEYVVLVTDRRSIFVRQKKTRSNFVLRQEMRFGTALVTDVIPKTLEDYEEASLETLANDSDNLTIQHESVISFSMRADPPDHRKRDFFVWMVMKRQKEIFQVYNFEIKFYAAPLGAYFKPKRQVQTRETILREYAMDVLGIYRSILPATVISSQAETGAGKQQSPIIQSGEQ